MKQFSIPLLFFSLVPAALSSSALADSMGQPLSLAHLSNGAMFSSFSSRGQDFAVTFSPHINTTSLMEGNSSGHNFYSTRISVAHSHSDSPTVRNGVLFTFADRSACKGFGDLSNLDGPPEDHGKEGHPILVPTGLFNRGSAFGHFGNNGTQGQGPVLAADLAALWPLQSHPSSSCFSALLWHLRCASSFAVEFSVNCYQPFGALEYPSVYASCRRAHSQFILPWPKLLAELHSRSGAYFE